MQKKPRERNPRARKTRQVPRLESDTDSAHSRVCHAPLHRSDHVTSADRAASICTRLKQPPGHLEAGFDPDADPVRPGTTARPSVVSENAPLACSRVGLSRKTQRARDHASSFDLVPSESSRRSTNGPSRRDGPTQPNIQRDPRMSIDRNSGNILATNEKAGTWPACISR